MWIQMVASVSGMRDGEQWPAFGSVFEISDSEGASLVLSGHAVETTEP